MQSRSKTNEMIKPRKVSMIELFYDLVFAYTVSNMTSLLESATEQGLSFFSFSVYLGAFLMTVSSWLCQTVYTNRYGDRTFVHSVFFYLQAAILLYISTAIKERPDQVFRPFWLAVALLSFLLFLEYLISYGHQASQDSRRLIRDELILIGLRSLACFLVSFLPFNPGAYIGYVIILSDLLVPFLIRRDMKRTPVNFGHLNERLTLLTIILFGEMIIQTAVYFRVEFFSLSSMIPFALVAALFTIYALFFGTMVRTCQGGMTGMGEMYLHYLILIGIDLTSVSFGLLSEPDNNRTIVLALLFGGLLLFSAGIIAGRTYLQRRYLIERKWIAVYALLFIATASGAWYASDPWGILSLAAFPQICAALALWMFYRNRKPSMENSSCS